VRTTTTCVVGEDGCATAKTTDTGKDTGDTGPKDTGDTGPKDTGDTGPKDTGDTGPKDTGDTGPKDTGGADTGGADTGEAPDTVTTVVEGLDHVYIVAGTFPSLNAVSLSPGVFYASVIQELDTANEHSHEDIVVELDTQVPKPVGWVVAEKEPNDAYDNGGNLVDPSLAQVLPTPSEPGLTDIVTAVQSFGKKHGGNDVDVFAIVPKLDTETLITMSWPEGDTVNLDMYLTDSAGNFLLAAYKISGDVEPEFMGTADLGSPLKGGQTYYIVVFSYKGPAGDHPYKLEIAIQ
jgi:hypothetical protein